MFIVYQRRKVLNLISSTWLIEIFFTSLHVALSYVTSAVLVYPINQESPCVKEYIVIFNAYCMDAKIQQAS